MKRTDFLNVCAKLLKPEQIIIDPKKMLPFLTDWRRHYVGTAEAILFPNNTQQCADLVKLCIDYGAAIIPQGGNTGLCGGATPVTDRSSTPQIVLSTRLLNQIRAIDLANRTLTAEAGCSLQQIRLSALAQQQLFPLGLGIEAQCTIGGNLSTNAGGVHVLRYGTARALCLGLEVVTPQGEIWQSLQGLRKDNSGYDLRDLFIGAEGTLGIITAATLKLFALPKSKASALAAVSSIEHAIEFFKLMHNAAQPCLNAFELMSLSCMQWVYQHFPEYKQEITLSAPYTVLVELASHQTQDECELLSQTLLTEAQQKNLIQNAAHAQNQQQAALFWHIREAIPKAQVKQGGNIKHDIALPLSQLAEFIKTSQQIIHDTFRDAQFIIFGHLGDGNLHYNVYFSDTAYRQHVTPPINQIVYDCVQRFGGSISAEHGIGQLKVQALKHYKNATELHLISAIKKTLDPENRMNPQKIVAL